MSKFLKYKGYIGSVEYSEEDEILFGQLQFINDTVLYESDDVKGIRKSFENAVDDYLKYCEHIGKEPNKTFKGSFNIRISPELHKSAAEKAFEEGITLNQFVVNAIQEKCVV